MGHACTEDCWLDLEEQLKLPIVKVTAKLIILVQEQIHFDMSAKKIKEKLVLLTSYLAKMKQNQ